jgi:hypothetical protein
VNDENKRNDEENANDIDDQFRALLEGLRTTIPGVMVLFAFLLTMPLQTSFADLSTGDRAAFYFAFATAAASAILLISPSVHQRVRAPISGIQRRTMRHVMIATKLTIAGTISFLLSIGAVVYLVTSLVLTTTLALFATLLAVVMAGWTWFYLPIVAWRNSQ